MSVYPPDWRDLVKVWRAEADGHAAADKQATSFDDAWTHRRKAADLREFASRLETHMQGTP